MIKRLGLVVLGALCFAAAAAAAGPGPYGRQGGAGTLSGDGSVRYVAVGVDSGTTVLTKIGSNGTLRKAVALPGSVGLPVLTYDGPGEGLSANGSLLVLQSTAIGAATTTFQLVRPRDLAPLGSIELPGTFGFDALSPDGKTLYLIQHRDASDVTHYVVRAYDLGTRRLLPGTIADRTQKSWVMQGFPVSHTTTPGGRWVFTLYQNPGGYPFIHALDTVKGVAHCIGLPWTSRSQAGLFNLVLAVRGNTLEVHRRSGASWLNVDRRTWRISEAPTGGFPSLWVGLGGAGLLAAAAGAVALRLRRRGRQEPAEQAAHDGGLAQREVVI